MLIRPRPPSDIKARARERPPRRVEAAVPDQPQSGADSAPVRKMPAVAE